MPNPKPKTDQLKPLKKGYDPRRNLKGVPKDAIAARKAIRAIGAELVKLNEGKADETEVTRFYIMIRAMFQSRQTADRIAILKALAPGLLTDSVEVTGKDGGPVEQKVTLTVEYVDKKPVDPDASTGT